jgi:ABC-2 type transport system permease protein
VDDVRLGGVLHHLHVAAHYATMSIRTQFERPLFLVSWMILLPAHWVAGVYVLRRLTVVFHSLAGWTAGEITFLYGLALLSHALTVIFFINTWSIPECATKGTFVDFQIVPLDVYAHLTFRYVNCVGMLDLLPAAAIMAYACGEIRFRFSVTNVLCLTVVIIAGMLARVGIFTIVGSVAFWTRRSGNLVGLTASVLERTTLYPLDVYPEWLRMLFTVIVPVAFIAFLPSVEVLRSGTLSWSIAFFALLVGVGLFTAGYVAFRVGLARSDGSGS